MRRGRTANYYLWGFHLYSNVRPKADQGNQISIPEKRSICSTRRGRGWTAVRTPNIGHERVASSMLFGDVAIFKGIANSNINNMRCFKPCCLLSLPTSSTEAIIGDASHSSSSLKSDLKFLCTPPAPTNADSTKQIESGTERGSISLVASFLNFNDCKDAYLFDATYL